MSFKPIQFLGNVTQAADNILQIVGNRGIPNEVHVGIDTAQTVIAVAAADQDAADRLGAVVAHMEGQGSLGKALKALVPALPARELAVLLAITDEITTSVGNDGRIDAAEWMAIVSRAVREAQND